MFLVRYVRSYGPFVEGDVASVTTKARVDELQRRRAAVFVKEVPDPTPQEPGGGAPPELVARLKAEGRLPAEHPALGEPDDAPAERADRPTTRAERRAARRMSEG